MDVICGSNTTYARNISGELYSWGANTFGGLNVGKYIDLPMPTTVTEPENAHYEQAAAGADFLIGLQYPGLLGDAKARVLAKNAFSKWRKKANNRAATPSTDMSKLTEMMREIAADVGIGEELKAMGMDFEQVLGLLLRANEDASIAHGAESANSATAAATTASSSSTSSGAGAGAGSPPPPSMASMAATLGGMSGVGDDDSAVRRVPNARRSTRVVMVALDDVALE